MRFIGSFGATMFTSDEYKILKILSDRKFHSGVEIGDAIGKTRTSVMNHIKNLTENGLRFNKVVGRGYQLQYIPLFYNKTILQKRPNLEYFDSIESTNSYLIGKSNFAEGSVVVSGYQTGGKGRRGRKFISRFGDQIMFSYACNFDDVTEIGGLSIVAGVSVVNALRELGQKNVGLKWPNDVYIDGKKAGGLLVESTCSTDSVRVVIGIGLNTTRDFLFTLDALAANRYMDCVGVAGNDSDSRSLFLLRLCSYIDADLQEYRKHGLSSFVRLFNEFDVYRGREVVVVTDKNLTYGINMGITSSGALLLSTENGEEKEILVGDVSLRLPENLDTGIKGRL